MEWTNNDARILNYEGIVHRSINKIVVERKSYSCKRLQYWVRLFLAYLICKKDLVPKMKIGQAKTVTPTQPEASSRRAKLLNSDCTHHKAIYTLLGLGARKAMREECMNV
jgi:hypothetical protein